MFRSFSIRPSSGLTWWTKEEKLHVVYLLTPYTVIKCCVLTHPPDIILIFDIGNQYIVNSWCTIRETLSQFWIVFCTSTLCGPGSSVGTATCYVLDGPGIESQLGGARFSVPLQTFPGAHPAFYTMGTRPFPGVNRPGRDVDHPPHLAPRLKKE